MNNPTPEDMKKMIETIFSNTDQFRAHHKLDPPGDIIGFSELLRLVFSGDEKGLSIFSQLDDPRLIDELWDMYQRRKPPEQR